ncbi:vesicle-trafficking protein SEC22b-like isoform X1 [Polyodon spathula]|uniref:vesicle-trafficking protein SEC22b-like isoform X1 n=1 Tax=Polyodon spathula TaxID=7913 RepID=UPI001B7EE2FA|nr:vesicle-trafficking protein SEC22b-like isoform X1 [Polyodon spathula]
MKGGDKQGAQHSAAFPSSAGLKECEWRAGRSNCASFQAQLKMVLLTMIARVADGLPLAASMQEDEQGREQSGRDLQQYQSQAKQLFRKLNEQSPPRCTLEAGAMSFHYVIEKGVCYLVLCEAGFSKKLAFAYLEDLQSEFDEQHGKRVPTVSRPYSFIEFDTYIQKTKKSYIDSRARRNLGNINTELQDVQRIMVANIEEVLQRGEALSALDSKASNLSSLSKKYRSDAKYLNTRSTYAKLAAVGVFLVMLIVYVRFWWL